MFDKPMTRIEYEAEVAKTRDARMDWWTKARFGMFVHYGPYAVAGCGEWYLATSGSGDAVYQQEVTRQFHPRRGCAYEWAKLAKEAGCKYMVLTTRHHDGYSLWDSDANPYNVVKYGGDYDVVAEYVDACRQYGLRIGLYHSIMDWHNPDGGTCIYDLEARMRFIQYHRDMLTELLTRYGKIDILWYDMCHPLDNADCYDFVNTNRMARQLQPDIIINPRSCLPEDMDTPEERLTPGGKQSYWEACMTFNGLSWGYIDSAEAAPYAYSAQQIIRMLAGNARRCGNLLLNIGPAPDGSVPVDAVEPLRTVGKWLKRNGAAVYGKRRPSDVWVPCGLATAKGNSLYALSYISPKLGYLPVNGVTAKVKKVVCLADGREREFTQKNGVVRILNVAPGQVDTTAGITVYELVCDKLDDFQLKRMPLAMGERRYPED